MESHTFACLPVYFGPHTSTVMSFGIDGKRFMTYPWALHQQFATKQGKNNHKYCSRFIRMISIWRFALLGPLRI